MTNAAPDRRAHTAWGRRIGGFLLLAGLLAGATGLLITAGETSPSGPDRCLSHSPSGVSLRTEGTPVDYSVGYWPLGEVCVYAMQHGAPLRVDSTDWTATLLVYGGTLAGLVGVALLLRPAALEQSARRV